MIFDLPIAFGRLLAAFAEVFPDEEMVIGRELTDARGITERTGKDGRSSDSIIAKGEFTVAIWNSGSDDEPERREEAAEPEGVVKMYNISCSICFPFFI